MKKTIFTLLVLAAFSVSVLAQATMYTSVIAKDTVFNISNNYPCPVISYNVDYSIAAVKMNATTTAFCLIDHSSYMGTPSMPVTPPVIRADAAILSLSSPVTDFTINDMVSYGSYVFFCGCINGTQAFYGFFNSGNFNITWGGGGSAGGTVSIYIYTLAPDPSGVTMAPATLNKLVAYLDNTVFKVVAIGNDHINLKKGISKIVEITDATGSPSCDVADLPSFPVGGMFYKIILDDIVLTTNYVAVLGHDVGAISVCNSMTDMLYPCIFVGRRGNVVSDISDPGYNCNYYLKKPWETTGSVIGVALPDNTIALAYSYMNESSNPFTRFRVIDIPNATNVNSQQFEKREKGDPVAMCFWNSLGKVELMQPMAHPSDFITLDPYAAIGYTTSVLNPNNSSFKSMIPIRYSLKHFIATRNTEIYIQDLTASLPHSSASCPSDFPLEVEMIDKLPLGNIMCDIIQGINDLDLIYKECYISIMGIPLNTQCFSYE